MAHVPQRAVCPALLFCCRRGARSRCVGLGLAGGRSAQGAGGRRLRALKHPNSPQPLALALPRAAGPFTTQHVDSCSSQRCHQPCQPGDLPRLPSARAPPTTLPLPRPPPAMQTCLESGLTTPL